MSPEKVLGAALDELEGGRAVALCAIVETRGSVPQPRGTIVCVDQAARMTGSIGGGCVEADVRRRAHAALASQRDERATFELDHDFGYDDGMICGGSVEVTISILQPGTDGDSLAATVRQLIKGEAATLILRAPPPDRPALMAGAEATELCRIALEPQPTALIAGAGHIGRVLAQMVHTLGFRVVVLDDRADHASLKRFPLPIQVVIGDIAEMLGGFPINANTYVVIVTRGHKHDERALAAVLDSPAKYIGMIGSRRKVKVTLDDLRRAGANEERLARVHAPIGLSIGSVTAEEIAVSIAAQLVAVRRSERMPPTVGHRSGGSG
ncbi:MAG: XdhC family protein [Planctomycetota bacterium]